MHGLKCDLDRCTRFLQVLPPPPLLRDRETTAVTRYEQVAKNERNNFVPDSAWTARGHRRGATTVWTARGQARRGPCGSRTAGRAPDHRHPTLAHRPTTLRRFTVITAARFPTTAESEIELRSAVATAPDTQTTRHAERATKSSSVRCRLLNALQQLPHLAVEKLA